MSDEGKPNYEVRDLELKVRGLKAENEDLRRNQGLWLRFCAVLSVLSCFAALVVIIVAEFGDSAAVPPSPISEGPGVPTAQGPQPAPPRSSAPVTPEVPELESSPGVPRPAPKVVPVPARPSAKHTPPRPEPEAAEAPEAPPAEETPGFALPGSTAPQGRVEIYTVKSRDSLWVISKKFYKDYDHVDRIRQENNLDPEEIIVPGMKLRIPLP